MRFQSRFFKESKDIMKQWGRLSLLYMPFLILIIILIPRGGHGSDVECWRNWSSHMFNEGLTKAYGSGTDYLPFFQYVLYLFGKLQGSLENIQQHIHQLKIIEIGFEFGTTLILFQFLHKKYQDQNKAILYSLFYFLNIAVLFNSLIWGQSDGVMTFFIFASVYFGYKKNLFPSLLCGVLAINMKLQAIVFLPLLGLLNVDSLLEIKKWKRTVLAVLGVLLVQVLLVLPFVYGGGAAQLWQVISGSVGKYAVISMNAYNMWFFFFQGNLAEISDQQLFFGLSCKSWGLLLFFISSFLALYPLLLSVLRTLFYKGKNLISLKEVLLAGALIPLLFFFFNTQMHERYSHPALIFLAAYALLYKKPIPYIVGSIAYFLNMEDVLQYFQTHNYGTLVYTPWFIAALYLLCIILLYIELAVCTLGKEKKRPRGLK